MAELLGRVLEWCEAFAGLGWSGVVLFALVYAFVSLTGMPGSPLTLLGGGLFGFATGTVAVMGGIAVGAAAGFLAARYLLRGGIMRRLLNSPKLRLVDEAVAHEGWRIVALLRLCPIPFGLSNYVYGMTGIDFRHYMMATLGAMLPGTMVFVYLGAVGRRSLEAVAGGSQERHPLELVLTIVTLLAIIGALAFIGRMVRRVVKKMVEADATRTPSGK